ncbi:hypothetical protein HMPREF9946_03992 [Acetobacteraceae bacterium AT-5844]|nr:hypothetical protein HMPREF9946_03992 [Acetobacteraceae bacterium AT-5844]
MSEFRLRVRDVVSEILTRRLPELGGRVYRAREWPLQEGQTPALLVYGYQEEKTGPAVHGGETSYGISWILSVQVRVEGRSRDTPVVEQELEQLCQAVSLALLTAPELLGEGGLIERIDSVKTTLNIDARTGETALGQALVAFDMRWTETYRLPAEIGCAETTFHFRVIPPA